MSLIAYSKNRHGKVWLKSNAMLLRRIIEEYTLYERLDVTHNAETSLDILTRWCGNDNIIFKTNIDRNRLKLQTRGKSPTKDEVDNILKWINNLGYYPASTFVDGNPKKFDYDELIRLLSTTDVFEITFEAKFDVEIGDGNLPNIAYHVTPTPREEKILRIGLAPKSKEKLAKHPERIYFLTCIEDVSRLLKNRAFCGDEKQFTIFEFDLGELKKRRVVRYFSDPGFPAGKAFYTYENIPPQYLKVVKRIRLGE